MNEIHHDEARQEFVITVDGERAGYCGYVTVDGTRVFNHTVVDEKFRGQGLSKPLIKAALDDTREAGLKVVATCSAVEHFIAKNEDYQDLLKG